MSNIRIGQTVRVRVRFIDFDSFAGTDDLLDPSSVSVNLYKYETTVYNLVSANLSPVIHESLGIYYYDWTITEDGIFKLLFTGILDGATPSSITNPRTFYVGTTEPTITLGYTAQYDFLPQLTPLYLDPDVVAIYWPEMKINPNGYAEVVEIIYRHSIFLQKWFGINVVITPLMEEYLLAVVLCELSRIYDDLLGNGSTAGGFTLGDLTVTQANAVAGGSKRYNRGNIDTWCEYAAMLRLELMQVRNGIKAVIRGSNFPNPIPPRHLRRFEKK